VIVRFVDIGEIVYHHSWDFLFTTISMFVSFLAIICFDNGATRKRL
jgi:hypothetical protein